MSDPSARRDLADQAGSGFADTVQLARALLGAPSAFLALTDGAHLQVVAETGIAVPGGRAPARLLDPAGLRPGPPGPGDVDLHFHLQFQVDLQCHVDLQFDLDLQSDLGGVGSDPFRFLARLRLSARDGVPLGTLCVLDTAPRAGLTPEQEAAFLALGRRTVDLLEGRVREATAALDAEAVRERYRLAARATRDAIRDWDLATDAVTWNAALQAAFGWDPAGAAATGAWWLAQVHPADRDRVEAALAAAIRDGRDAWTLEYRFLRADGSHAEVLDRGSVIRRPDGTPLRMVGAMLDLTERNRVAADFHAIFEGANVGIVQLDPHSLEVLSVNAKLCAIWGAPAAAIVGRSVALWTPQEDAAERDTLHRRLAAGEVLRETLEKRYRRADGRIIWARVNLVSQALGDRLQTTAMIEDITLERTTEARHRALIALGDALRDASGRTEAIAAAAAILGATLGAMRAGYGAVDAAAGLFRVESAWTAAGAHPAEPLAEPLDEPLAEPPPPCPLAAFPETLARLASGLPQAIRDVGDPALAGDAAAYAALRARAAVNVPLARLGRLAGVLFVHAPEPRDWAAGEIAFVREVAERLWGTLGRIEAEDQQSLRNRELSHRLKNTLAMVQAIASQTLRNAPDFETAKEALAARLIALGKAHDILLTGARESAGIAAVIAGALAIHDDGQAGRLALDGPAIEVGPKAALSLALMIHELATNAVKYGALSVPGGRVAVTWSLEPDAVVRMLWTERGGPAVAPPTRKGFGSRLIERGLAGAVGGSVGLAYEPEGVVCRVEAPLSGFQAAG